MRDGVLIPAWLMRLLVLGTAVLVVLGAVREYPGLRRYLKSGAM